MKQRHMDIYNKYKDKIETRVREILNNPFWNDDDLFVARNGPTNSLAFHTVHSSGMTVPILFLPDDHELIELYNKSKEEKQYKRQEAILKEFIGE